MSATALSTLAQAELFPATPASALAGLKYQADFLAPDEELALLDSIGALALKEAEYKQWRAHRRTIGYGGKYDFSVNELLPAAPIPSFLFALRARIAAWIDVAACDFNHALIAEYRTGTQLGWHCDVAHFESVVGVSLAGAARMRFRPYPPRKDRRQCAFTLDLAPRSVYALQGPARWDWQHAVSATKILRYSVTFRTLTHKSTRRSG
jgi:alkylated DNA repair dioxygenase AlkB